MAVARLKAHETELRQLGVRRPYMFASKVQGEAQEGSNVDLFFDYERGQLGLFEPMEKERTSEILGCRANIMMRDSLHRFLRPQIEAAAMPVF